MSRPSPRIAKELKEIQSLPADSGLSACLVGSDMMHWKGTITGPDNTPYKGGVFCVDIVLPSDYPFVPPKMRFDTKVWHPNVSSANGAICLDILKSEWSPALTIRTALLSLQALLSCPNPDDPQDGVVAKQYKTDKALWEKTAKFWTEQHAKPPSTDNKQDEKSAIDEEISLLLEMGFDKASARQAFIDAQGNLDRAIAILTA